MKLWRKTKIYIKESINMKKKLLAYRLKVTNLNYKTKFTRKTHNNLRNNTLKVKVAKQIQLKLVANNPKQKGIKLNTNKSKYKQIN